MDKDTRVVKFEGGPLHGDSMELPANVTEHTTLSLETNLTQTPGSTAKRVFERQDILYKETPAGSGRFVFNDQFSN